jgi:hypothetical protein
MFTAKSLFAFTAALAAAASVLVAAQSASAGQPFDRCPDDFNAWASLPGPAICDAAWSEDRFLPAGSRCSFDVAIHIDFTARLYHYDWVERTDAHIVAAGVATNLANGKALERIARFTEIASGPIVFTDHGVTRYTLPDGRTITVLAGFTRDSEVPPLPEVFHGNPFDDADVAAFCAALS